MTNQIRTQIRPNPNGRITAGQPKSDKSEQLQGKSKSEIPHTYDVVMCGISSISGTRRRSYSWPPGGCTGMRYPCGMPPVMSLRESRARAEHAYQLRAIGRSWRQVAGELGYKSVGAAQLAVKRHEQRQDPITPETSRRSLIESARVTTAVLFDRFAAAAEREDDRTLVMLNGEIARNRDQLAKLTGAYMPVQSEVDLNVRQSPSQILNEYRDRLLEAMDVEVVDQKEIER